MEPNLLIEATLLILVLGLSEMVDRLAVADGVRWCNHVLGVKDGHVLDV